MCGITGYVGSKLAVPIVLDCLKNLEYRGYDSAGIAYLDNIDFGVIKKVGNLNNLSNYLSKKVIPASCAIGHTRWATHGQPNEANSHPQVDFSGKFALVHNGIIENYNELKKQLMACGIDFKSQTDTETIVQLLSREYANIDAIYSQNHMHSTLHSTILQVLKAIYNTTLKLKGTYACAFVVKGMENCIFFFKNQSPLVLGKSKVGYFLSSDVSALLMYTDQIYNFQDYQFGFISPDGIGVYDETFNDVNIDYQTIQTKPQQISLGKYSYFMEKEINQGVTSVLDTIKDVDMYLDKLPLKLFSKDRGLHIVGCGTALNAGRVGKWLIEKTLRLPVSIEFASEFRYKHPIIKVNDLAFFISQSGETADALYSLELSKKLGAIPIAITNTPTSRIRVIADYYLPTNAGIEVSVASTKTFLAQIAVFYALVDKLANLNNINIGYSLKELESTLIKFKDVDYSNLMQIANEIKCEESIYFIGRGIDYILAMEGALKLKEVSYIHCESIPAGELKHGSLALINNNTVVIAILTQKNLKKKILNNLQELSSRGARIYLFSQFTELESFVYKLIKLPYSKAVYAPFLASKPLQLLAYYTALAKNLNPDKPRNLAKSVTVE